MADEQDIFEQHTERYVRKIKIALVFLAMFIVYFIVFMINND